MQGGQINQSNLAHDPTADLSSFTIVLPSGVLEARRSWQTFFSHLFHSITTTEHVLCPH